MLFRDIIIRTPAEISKIIAKWGRIAGIIAISLSTSGLCDRLRIAGSDHDEFNKLRALV